MVVAGEELGMAKRKAKAAKKPSAKVRGKATKAKRPRTQRLANADGPGDVEGFTHDHHPDITDAAERYREVRDERMALTEAEGETKKKLHDLMKKHSLTVYVDEDAELRVDVVTVDETVKVGKWKPKKEKTESTAEVA